MARRIRCFEVYLPLEYNDARAIEESKFLSLQEEFVNRFGGVASNERRFPLHGLWQRGARIFRDKVVVFAAMDFGGGRQSKLIEYLEELKVRLKEDFRQLDVLITLQNLMAI